MRSLQSPDLWQYQTEHTHFKWIRAIKTYIVRSIIVTVAVVDFKSILCACVGVAEAYDETTRHTTSNHKRELHTDTHAFTILISF